jgi:nucleoside-diphosphate-sugar epimerase
MGMALAVNDPAPSIEPNAPLVVVAGATGFIGRHLCQTLHDSGYRVRAIVRPQSADKTDSLVADDIRIIELADPALVDALSGATAAVNAVGAAHTGTQNRLELHASNVQASSDLAAAAHKAGIPRLIHFSSILARKPQQSYYAASKLEGEQAALRFADSDFSVVILRPANVYGPGMQGNWMTLIQLIEAGRMPPLPRLDNAIALVSVQHLCRIAEALLGVSRDALANPPKYSISDSQTYTPSAIEEEIYTALGRKKPAWHTPRVLFFAAAILADLLNKIRLINVGFGRASYQNLISENTTRAEDEHAVDELVDCQSEITFFTQLPELIARGHEAD